MNNEELIMNNKKSHVGAGLVSAQKMKNNTTPVGAPFVGIPKRHDTTVPEKNNKINANSVGAAWHASHEKTTHGITLIALIITIIIMIILAGVVLSLTIGERGIFKTAQNAGQKMEEASAKEKLELVLLDLQTDKITDVNYNETEYINTKIQANEMVVKGDIVLVDGWQFQIDRSVPEIIANLGKGQPEEQIEIGLTSTTSTDYVKATITIEITYEKEIASILLNGEDIEIPEKEDGKYIIEKDVTSNGIYTVIAKDAEDKYNMKSIKISDITENMDIYTTGDLVKFRDMVNSGRTFEGRTVCLMNDLDLSGVCGENIGNWTPIGITIFNDNLEEILTPFSGTFKGNKHTINNLYINDSDGYYKALFGACMNSEISNLTLDNATVVVKDLAGGIIAFGDGDTEVSDCHVKNSNIQAIGEDNLAYAGGVVGNAGPLKITNCSSENSTITGRIFVGGIVSAMSGTIASCYNSSRVNGRTNTGGIVGGNGGTLLVKNCYNTGEISITSSGVGGIFGTSQNMSSGVTITNCYNIGAISSGSIKGAIIGYDRYGLKKIEKNYWTSNSGTSYGRGYKKSNTGAEVIEETTLQGYASTLNQNSIELGYEDDVWANDVKDGEKWKYNNGYPIFKWQLER